MQQLNRSLHIIARTACNTAEQSCKETECAELYAHRVCRKETEGMARYYYRDGRRKSGGGENTDKGRKIAQEILSF